MKRINLFLICVLANIGFSSILFAVVSVEGFVAGTLVKTPTGYSQIETIMPGDMVMSCDFKGHCAEREVTDVRLKETLRYIRISVGGTEISVGFSGRLFTHGGAQWVNATSVDSNLLLMNALYQTVPVDNVETIYEKVQLYRLSVDEFQNYYVSSADILVHNYSQEEMDRQFAMASPRDRAQVLIMEQFQKQKFNNPMQLSYILATAEHETGNFRHMKEIGGEKKSYAPWYGRGYAQLTHKENYEKYSKRLRMDLIANADLMLREDVSAAVIVDGMMYGAFTNVGLPHFINDNRCDFVQARITVNAKDKQHEIAAIARKWAAYFRDRCHNGQYTAALSWLKWLPIHDKCH
ncbi:MAG: polymorphic toxin-type HINT domain-containing protein [Myxococcaceae bacterium]